jgi:pseudouridylate synthase
MTLLKYLQAQGIASRASCRRLIQEGSVVINGVIKGDTEEIIVPTDVRELAITGKKYDIIPLPYFYILLHKPAGVEVSHSPSYYPSVFSLLTPQLRQLKVQAVGRLDVDSTGLLLITNDNLLNHRLTSPKHDIEKEYVLTLAHDFSEQQSKQLLTGFYLRGEKKISRAKMIKKENERKIIMVLCSGKYHEAKRMMAAVGNRVLHLHRSRLGELYLGQDLSEGTWRYIDSTLLAEKKI